jgi:5'-3' exonuclease
MTSRASLGCAIAIGIAMQASATPNKEAYELQERCGKRAEEIFLRYFGNNGIQTTKDGQTITAYRNHYNSKLNKCFVVTSSTNSPNKDKKQKPSIYEVLSDVDENRDYGTFFKFTTDSKICQCTVFEKACTSQAEWEALIRPFMED